MFGKNPIRKPVTGDGSELDIQSIFPTLQGEGIYAGFPSIFVRLGGCNLACRFCDTEFESYNTMKLDEIIAQVSKESINSEGVRVRNLAVITGGEPMRQPIEKLCELLINDGYMVQIETNGTIYRKLPSSVDIVCSPKVSGNKYHRIREDLLPSISAFKFIISAHQKEYSSVQDVGQSVYKTPVYVQPMDEYDEQMNIANTKLAVKLALENGYRLSLQTHKYLGIE